ncbi:MAG: site-2 protease family protein [Planctomycetota bacterium]|jgi:regulator of sigma E protease
MAYVLIFLMISFLILVHEFGHFCAAKCVGIPVKQFSIGYGPKLWGFQFRGTEYRLSVFPVGGYVMPEVKALDDYFAFSLKSRLIFTLAGPLANIIAAWAGLLVMSMFQSGPSLHSVCVAPFTVLWTMTIDFLQSIPMIFSNPKQMSGVVGLVAFGGQQVGLDVMRLLSLAVLLNINLAFLNLLPILPLDGGKVVVDILHRLQLPVRRIYVPVALAGWAMILLLMIYVTINDVSTLMT